jgi:hypothetical protein
MTEAELEPSSRDVVLKWAEVMVAADEAAAELKLPTPGSRQRLCYTMQHFRLTTERIISACRISGSVMTEAGTGCRSVLEHNPSP